MTGFAVQGAFPSLSTIMDGEYHQTNITCSISALCKSRLYIYIYAFSRRFYPERLTVHSGYTSFLSVCVFPGTLNIILACRIKASLHRRSVLW